MAESNREIMQMVPLITLLKLRNSETEVTVTLTEEISFYFGHDLQQSVINT